VRRTHRRQVAAPLVRAAAFALGVLAAGAFDLAAAPALMGLGAIAGGVAGAVPARAASSQDPAPAPSRGSRRAPDRFDTVVLDPGHGGDDEGARGVNGILEKDLVLDVVRRLRGRLEAAGLHVVLTRDHDVYVSLERRTAIANDAHADLFVSVHANAAPVRAARGVETFFLSLDASDEAARQVAARENAAFRDLATPAAGGDDPLVAILGDMAASEQLQESSDFARIAQREVSRLEGGPSRGVKQAPLVVLMGLQMPASLVEIGFVTNPTESRALASDGERDRIADGLSRAILQFGRRYDARRGIGAAESVPAAPASSAQGG
jgi:N-acetylmuramoyl-L-alanine amidase